ncbi:hypothetical protein C2G38_2047778 [Gigaspora rosea]|uniref:Uncharacterized protein n=1 Tax=Gigaspora rosea TaxID=44941 RepID=A0A397U4K4_9GLOM|nr:hypothetical protein C2G38_2047778 [Gigaspora rosea]
MFIIYMEKNQCLFGINPIIEEWQKKLDNIFIQLIKEKLLFCAEDIDISIKKYVKSALFVATSNVVIFQPDAEKQVLNRLENYKDALLLFSEIVKELVKQLEEVEQLLKLSRDWTSAQVR